MRTENDLRAALRTLEPDPAPADLMTSVRHRIARQAARRRLTRGAGVAGLAVAAAAVALVAAGLVPGSPGRSPARGQVAGGRTTGGRTTGGITGGGTITGLRTLALVASAQPEVRRPGPGQYWYTAVQGLSLSCLRPVPGASGYGYFSNCSIRVRYIVRIQTWAGWNGSGRVVTTTISARFASPRDRARWIRAGRPPLRTAPVRQTYGPHQLYLGPRNLWTLPTSPARLAALLYGRRIEGGPPGAAEDFTQVGDLLRYSDAPPALRAAVFRVAERMRGVRVLGTVTLRGVTGVGVEFRSYPPKRYLPRYSGDYHLSELIFSPRTSDLVAERYADVTGGGRTTVADDWVIYLASGLARSDASVPAG